MATQASSCECKVVFVDQARRYLIAVQTLPPKNKIHVEFRHLPPYYTAAPSQPQPGDLLRCPNVSPSPDNKRKGLTCSGPCSIVRARQTPPRSPPPVAPPAPSASPAPSFGGAEVRKPLFGGRGMAQMGERAKVVKVEEKGGFGFARKKENGGDVYFRIGSVHPKLSAVVERELGSCGVMVGDEVALQDVEMMGDQAHARCGKVDIVRFSERSQEVCRAVAAALVADHSKLGTVRKHPSLLELAFKGFLDAEACLSFLCGVMTHRSDDECAVWAGLLSPHLPDLLEPDGIFVRSGGEWLRSHRSEFVSFAEVCSRHLPITARLMVPIFERMTAREGLSLFGNARPNEDGELLSGVLRVLRASHPLLPSHPTSYFQWDELPRVPTTGELLGREGEAPLYHADSLSRLPHVVEGEAYESASHYLETYYRLYRADCFIDLSKSINAYLRSVSGDRASAGLKYDPRDLAVFTDISLIPRDLTPMDSHELVYSIMCRPVSPRCVRGSNLSFGNLLCISISGSFDDIVWATVAQGPSIDVKAAFRTLSRREFSAPAEVGGKVPLLNMRIQFASTANKGTDPEALVVAALARGAPNAVMVENPVFFVSYEPMLHAISSLRCLPAIPFQQELVTCSCEGQGVPPDCDALLSVKKAHPEIFGTLDPQQNASYEHVAKHRVSVVQGPPGTGKSYLGARLVYALMSTLHSNKERVLLISYKNHSLDEMLLDVNKLFSGGLELGTIARLGRSPKMHSEVGLFTLENIYNNAKSRRALPLDHVVEMAGAIGRVELHLSEVRTWAAVLNSHVTLLSFSQCCQVAGRCRELSDAADFAKWARPGLEEIARDLSAKIASVEPDLPDFDRAQTEKGEADEDLQKEAEAERLREEDERLASLGFARQVDLLTECDRIPSLSSLARFYKPQSELDCLRMPFPLPIHKGRTRAAYVSLLRDVLLAVHQMAVEMFRVSLDAYNHELAPLRFMRSQLNADALKENKLLACTAVGAAIHHDLIALLRPTVLMVEEAAEIPEPVLISAILPSLKRVVMIGDHKQLRASVASYELQKTHHLDISAFERLMRCSFPFEKLHTQNRMMPAMLFPVTQHYPFLESNTAIVGKLQHPPWLSKPAFWWTHHHNESSCEGLGRSHSNTFEADRCVLLCSFLLKQGIPPSQITILTPYVGQKAEIRARLKRRSTRGGAALSDVEALCIDEFQGDENMIIILSLVRSSGDSTGTIGFLHLQNRQIVATSRHKVALVIVGNHKQFMLSPDWRRLVATMEAMGCVGEELPLSCPRHPKADPILFNVPGERWFTVEGCGQTCDAKLSACPHLCAGRCHGPEAPHWRCSVMVPVSYPDCPHVDSKRPCGESPENTHCHEHVVFTCPKCATKKAVLCQVPARQRRLWVSVYAAMWSGLPFTGLLDLYQQSRHCAAPGGLLLAVRCQQPTEDQEKGGRRGLDTHNSEKTAAELASFWGPVLSRLCQEDFDLSLDLDRSFAEDGYEEEFMAYENLVSLVLSELGIRVPASWAQLPQCWAFLALRDRASPGTLDSVREVIRPLLKASHRPLQACLHRDLSCDVRRLRETIVSWMTQGLDSEQEVSSRFRSFRSFADGSMPSLAKQLSDNVGVGCLNGLFPDQLVLGQTWGLTMCSCPSDQCPPFAEVPKDSLYLPKNEDKTFVTVDLRRADFAVLSLLDPDITLHTQTWEEFVRLVVELTRKQNPYIFVPGLEKLRGIRTRLLGQLCHKKNAALQSHVLRLIVRAIVYQASGYSTKSRRPFEKPVEYPVERVFRFSCDELVVQCKKASDWAVVQSLVTRAIKELLPALINVTRVEAFTLKRVQYTPAMLEDKARFLGTMCHGKYHHPEFATTFREPPYHMDPEWEDPKYVVESETETDRDSFYVRCSLDGGSTSSVVPKKIPASLLADGLTIAILMQEPPVQTPAPQKKGKAKSREPTSVPTTPSPVAAVGTGGSPEAVQTPRSPPLSVPSARVPLTITRRVPLSVSTSPPAVSNTEGSPEAVDQPRSSRPSTPLAAPNTEQLTPRAPLVITRRALFLDPASPPPPAVASPEAVDQPRSSRLSIVRPQFSSVP